eukprot:1734863-Pleurochrysis_carterae.AAC.10
MHLVRGEERLLSVECRRKQFLSCAQASEGSVRSRASHQQGHIECVRVGRLIGHLQLVRGVVVVEHGRPRTEGQAAQPA